jgi:hypothetical protein
VVRAAETLDQRPLPFQVRGVRPGEAVVAGDVHGEQVGALGACRDPCRTPDEGVALRAAGEGDDHALPGLPRRPDAVVGAVPVELLVDLVREPQQGQLSQRGEVPDPEVVAQRRIDRVRRVDVAVREPPSQRLRRHVDELDLLGLPDHRVRHRLVLLDAGDLLDDVVDRLQVLDVDGRDNRDPGCEQLLDVLPALGVAGPRGVRVRELVHERDVGPARQEGLEVHLAEGRPAVGHRRAGKDLEPPGHRLRVPAAVGLHEPDDDVGPALAPSVALLEHLVRLADARCGTEVDTQLTGHRQSRRG